MEKQTHDSNLDLSNLLGFENLDLGESDEASEVVAETFSKIGESQPL